MIQINFYQSCHLLKLVLITDLPFAFSTGGISSIVTRGFLLGGSGESGESFMISASASSSFSRSNTLFNL